MRFPVLLFLASVVATGTVSCRPRKASSELKVRGGREAAEREFLPVVRLDLDGKPWCTGTFLSGSVVLTAAHCFYNVTASRISVRGKTALEQMLAADGFAEIFRRVRESRYERDAPDYIRFISNDLALVRFPDGTAAELGLDKFFRIQASAPSLGDNVYVVGFGDIRKNDTSAAKKRWGENEIEQIRATMVRIVGSPATGFGYDSVPLNGDSGGPLLMVNDDERGDETIVGTVSTVPGDDESHTATYAYASSSIAQQLYRRAHARGWEAFDYGFGLPPGASEDDAAPPEPAPVPAPRTTPAVPSRPFVANKYKYWYTLVIESSGESSRPALDAARDACYPEVAAALSVYCVDDFLFEQFFHCGTQQQIPAATWKAVSCVRFAKWGPMALSNLVGSANIGPVPVELLPYWYQVRHPDGPDAEQCSASMGYTGGLARCFRDTRSPGDFLCGFSVQQDIANLRTLYACRSVESIAGPHAFDELKSHLEIP